MTNNYFLIIILIGLIIYPKIMENMTNKKNYFFKIIVFVSIY